MLSRYISRLNIVKWMLMIRKQPIFRETVRKSKESKNTNNNRWIEIYIIAAATTVVVVVAVFIMYLLLNRHKIRTTFLSN